MDGKVVFVTGGARGIGLDAAQRVAAMAARVVLVDVDETLAKTEAERQHLDGRFAHDEGVRGAVEAAERATRD